MGVFGACLAAEVFCYSVLALFVYAQCTNRIGYYTKETVVDNVHRMMDFIKSGSGGNRIIRVLAVNKSLNGYNHRVRCDTLCEYIDRTMKDGAYEKLYEITFYDIRQHCRYPDRADVIAIVWNSITSEVKWRIDDYKGHHINIMDKLVALGQLSLCVCIVFVFGPIWLLSKLVQIVYPWIIIGYLLKNELLFGDEIDTFQLVMLAIYTGLQLLLLVLGGYIGRTQYLLWHIEPGCTWTCWSNIKGDELIAGANKFYDDVYWYPQVTQIVLNSFGGDIGNIIMDYCKSFNI